MDYKALNHPDRLFPTDSGLRALAKALYRSVASLPILSPHGHTAPEWFAENECFSDPASVFVIPDHYVFRMLYSHGIKLEDLGVRPKQGVCEKDARKIWRLFAQHFYLFRGTPSSLWLNQVFAEVFALEGELKPANADHFYDSIAAQLRTEAFRPRALFERFRLEVLATTDEAVDELSAHQKIKKDWGKRVLPTFRPDRLTDPEHEDFSAHIQKLQQLTGENTAVFSSYLKALRQRRQYFLQNGATATDHGAPSAFTCVLSALEMQKLLDKALAKTISAEEAQRFRGAMLVEMARMSLDDGLVMQVHPGSYRNHNEQLFQKFGRDVGADIPTSTNYTQDLRPLLNTVGNETKLKLIIFTLDESRYASELAPLAGHYPALKLGPAWWFHDSPEGMLRFRRMTTETAGFYNSVGFNDDTRAFFSIPARHDLARRMDAHFLAEWVGLHRLTEAQAAEIIEDLAYRLPKEAYNL